MLYDFTDPKTIAQINEIIKKNYSDLSDSEAQLLIEYKSDMKAEKMQNSNYLSAIKELQAKTLEYEKKLSDLSDAAAQAQYTKMQNKLSESE